MLDQMPMRPFEATGSLAVDPPIPLANANGNRDMYFQQRVVQYDVKCGKAQSTFDVVEKKWTGLPLLCACRRSFEVTVAVPLCMWGGINRRRVRDAFRSALVMSATHEAAKSCLRGQPLIRDIVGRIWAGRINGRTDTKLLQVEEQRKKVLDEIEASTGDVFDTGLWRAAGWTQATHGSLVFEVEEPVPFKWTYNVTAEDVELDAEELRQKIIDYLDLH